MTWTNPQSEAIKSRNQNLLLAAAAGSGKTAVLVERIIQRLSESGQPLDITEILIVTFTKAAAGEMRERIGAALTKKLEEDDGALADEVRTHVEQQLALLPAASISTFHAFCQHVLRTYFYTIDLDPRFTVAGTEELEILRQTVLEDLFLAWYEDKERRPSSPGSPTYSVMTEAMTDSWILLYRYMTTAAVSLGRRNGCIRRRHSMICLKRRSLTLCLGESR